jgi:hypothetical protein
MSSPEYDAAAAAHRSALEELDTLAERAWSTPVASLQDLIPFVEVALARVERAPNGALIGTPASDSPHPCCPFERAQTMLLLAVARLTG